MKCQMCRDQEALYFVTVNDLEYKTDYKYTETYRCQECADRAKRSFEDVEIEKL